MSDIVKMLRKWNTTESMRRSTESLVNEAADVIEVERALTDDADYLISVLGGDKFVKHPDVQRWLARYREARGRP